MTFTNSQMGSALEFEEFEEFAGCWVQLSRGVELRRYAVIQQTTTTHQDLCRVTRVWYLQKQESE